MNLDPGFAGMTMEQLLDFDRRLDVEHERVLAVRSRKGIRYPSAGYFLRMHQASDRVQAAIAELQARQAAPAPVLRRPTWRCPNCGAHAQTGDACKYCRAPGPFLTGRPVVNQATVHP